MRLTIAGVHMDVGEALREHAQARMSDLKTYFSQVLDVNVAFVHEAHHHHLHRADVTVHAQGGLMLRAEGQGVDWYGALDDASDKLSRQLKKYKGKLARHHARQSYREKVRDLGPIAFEEATFSGELVDDAKGGVIDGVPVDGVADMAGLDGFAPDIVKKEVSQIAPMTVDEAVMQMDLLHKPAFLFMNEGTNQLNMVYRDSGNVVRWVAPKVAA